MSVSLCSTIGLRIGSGKHMLLESRAFDIQAALQLQLIAVLRLRLNACQASLCGRNVRIENCMNIQFEHNYGIYEHPQTSVVQLRDIAACNCLSIVSLH